MNYIVRDPVLVSEHLKFSGKCFFQPFDASKDGLAVEPRKLLVELFKTPIDRARDSVAQNVSVQGIFPCLKGSKYKARSDVRFAAIELF